MSPIASSNRAAFWHGFRASLPVAIGCTPFAIAYGAVAAGALSIGQTSLMSLTVFAGTAQFIAVSMLAQGSALLPVLVTGALVNVRLVLLSAAISPHLRGISTARRLLSAQALTDETFALSVTAFRQLSARPTYLLGSGLALYLFWQAASLLGRVAGGLVPQGFGLEYALPASVICLLSMLVRTRRQWAVAILAMGLTLLARQFLPSAWVVLVATVCAATLGMGLRRWQ